MDINLYINDLIEWKDHSQDSLIERIIWIDEGYSIAFLFDLKATKGFPYSKSMTEITEAIAYFTRSHSLFSEKIRSRTNFSQTLC